MKPLSGNNIKGNWATPLLHKQLCRITGWGKLPSEMRWPHLSMPADIEIAVRASCRRQLPDFF